MRLFLAVILITKITLFADPCSAPLLGASHSGAPGEVRCTGCHSGSANSGPGNINYLIGNGTSTYSPNELFAIVFSMDEEDINQFGFQTVALKASNNSNAGTFTITDSVNTRLIADDHNGSDRIYVGHTECGADADPPGSIQWSFDWQAPGSYVGDIKFYFSSLATNHSHTTSDDHTYTQVITLVSNEVGLGVMNEKGYIGLPDDFQLISAYPNPFNSTTTINCALPIASKVSLKVYTLQGKEVATIVNSRLNTGYHALVWNASNQSSGLYIVKMVPGNFNTQKLIIIK
jgi:hypothetical protein